MSIFDIFKTKKKTHTTPDKKAQTTSNINKNQPVTIATKAPIYEKTIVEKPIVENSEYNEICFLLEKTNEEDIPVGSCKSGGSADLPADITYPVYPAFDFATYQFVETEREINGELRRVKTQAQKTVYHCPETAMQLIMQINFAEVAEFDTDNLLPKTGMLYFFWQANPIYSDDTIFKVLYSECADKNLLKRTPPPFEINTKELTMPGYDFNTHGFYEDAYPEKPLEITKATELKSTNSSDCDLKLLGEPYISNQESPKDNEINLLQFPIKADNLCCMNFYIDKDDLKNRDFSNIRLVCDYC
jgi:uncharacterized protein YwqG